MSAAIEELIHTSYLKNKNEILPGMVYIYLVGHAMSCMFPTLTLDVGMYMQLRQLCCSVQTGLKPR